MTTVARHKTALKRHELSRPIRAAIADGILGPESTVLDYGCGLGDDVRLLLERGIAAVGWDPVHAPSVPLQSADIINLGYVLNVIEHPGERVETLRKAWQLARRVLVVSVRLTIEGPGGHDILFGDGYLTRLGTFQKYFDQSELKALIQVALDEVPVAAGPGVFYVFRDSSLKESLLAGRHRRAIAAPRVRKSDQLFEQHREQLAPLMDFVASRGRLPEVDELPDSTTLEGAFGTLKQAFAIVRRVTGEGWAGIRETRSQDLLVYLGLARFEGRPPFSKLPRSLQLDIRAFFSTYANACRLADEQLFAAGKQDLINKLCASAPIGKQTPTALYLHVSVLGRLPTVLRVFEGCARMYMGTSAGANIVKIHRDKAAVSYLYYPTFETDAHPALAGSMIVYLQGPAANYRDYSRAENPPILHRKEDFVGDDYPARDKFAKLTRSEEAAGLYERTDVIGTRDGWRAVLLEKGLRIQGHRLLRGRVEPS